MSLSAIAERWRDASPREVASAQPNIDELDRLVAEAYGWPWPMETEEILARLVALHDERVEEEKRGPAPVVRWLRPDYQVPRFGDKVEGDLTLAVLPDEDDDEIPDDLPDLAVRPLRPRTGGVDGPAVRPR